MLRLNNIFSSCLPIFAVVVLLSGPSELNTHVLESEPSGLVEYSTVVNDGVKTLSCTTLIDRESTTVRSTQDDHQDSDTYSFLSCLPEIEDSEKQYSFPLLGVAPTLGTIFPTRIPHSVHSFLSLLKRDVILSHLRTVVLLN